MGQDPLARAFLALAAHSLRGLRLGLAGDVPSPAFGGRLALNIRGVQAHAPPTRETQAPSGCSVGSAVRTLVRGAARASR